MNQAIPVTIVTGFLGSGKTTLLRSLIKSRQTRRLALLINEFGEVSIDGALLRDSAEGNDQIRIHDFPDGLIAYGDDRFFIPTMRAIAADRANIDHVLIETSGLALPTAIMEVLQGPELAALMSQSARLERLLALANDDGASTASTAAVSLEYEDRLHQLDAELEASRDPDAQLPLWRQRLQLLRQVAALEASRHYLASEGRSLDVALVAAY